MLVGFGLCEQYFANSGKLRRGLGDCPTPIAGNQHVDFPAERLGGGHRFSGRVFEDGVIVVGKQQRPHYRTPASFLSLSISSATDLSLTPALRCAGSTTLSTSNRGLMSRP